MANGSQTVTAVITADAQPFKRAVQDAGSSFDSFSNVVKTGALITAAAIAGISVAIYNVGKDAVKAATEYEDVAAAVGQIFGEASSGLIEFAKQAPTLLGQSQNAFLGAVKQFGVFGNAAGLAGDANAEFSKQLAILATDLRSFNGGTVEEAINAIGAGLRGESEPLKRYGVMLDDATLKAEAMALGIYDGSGVLTAQQKILAAQSSILKKTGVQQGDFARTQDSMANSASKLNAQLEDVKLTIGNALIPVLQPLVENLANMFNEMKDSPEFKQFIADLAANFADLASKLQDALPQLATLAKDTMPVLAELVPIVAESIKLLGTQLGFVDSNSAGASSNLKIIGDFFKFVGDSLKNLNDYLAAFNQWLDDTNLNLLFIGSPLLGLEGNLNAINDALEIAIGLWDMFWGISTQNSMSGITNPANMLDRRLSSVAGASTMSAKSTYNISVNAIAPTAEVGRAVVDSIRSYQRVGGAF